MLRKVFRLSIEWARIEPQQGEVDDAAVRRYHEIFDSLDRYCTKMPFARPARFRCKSLALLSAALREVETSTRQ